LYFGNAIRNTRVAAAAADGKEMSFGELNARSAPVIDDIAFYSNLQVLLLLSAAAEIYIIIIRALNDKYIFIFLVSCERDSARGVINEYKFNYITM